MLRAFYSSNTAFPPTIKEDKKSRHQAMARFAVNHCVLNGNNVAVDYINTLGAGAGFNTKALV